MRRWFGLVLAAGVVLGSAAAVPAQAQGVGRGSVARSFDLGDLGGLGDLLGLGGGDLGGLADIFGLGGGGDGLGGILGDVLGGRGGSRDRYDDRYSDRYDDRYSDRYEDEEYAPRYRRQRSRRTSQGDLRDRIFGRLDLGANGFVERPEISRYARRAGSNPRRSQASFNRLDRNRDGRLSRSEFGRLFR